MFVTRRWFSSAAVIALTAVGSRGGSALAQVQSKGLIGIAMPTMTSQRWIVEGLAMTREFSKLGYVTSLQYADNNVALQIKQLEEMLQKGAKVLVIGSIDGTKLASVLKKAADNKVKIISYDRLIRGSEHVDYYASFDNFKVGVLQATDIVNRLELDKGKGPFKIEFFGGSDDDNNAFFFYDGAMSVLNSYLQSGKLVVPSGEVGMPKVATKSWSGSAASGRMVGLLTKYYAKDKTLDAILSPYDGISMGLIETLIKEGYGQAGQPLPIITGQDAELPSVRAIFRKKQSSTVFKDTRELAKVVTAMVDALLSGKKPTINDEKSYNNGIKVVPSFLLTPVLVTASNAKAVLVDSQYYRAEQIR